MVGAIGDSILATIRFYCFGSHFDVALLYLTDDLNFKVSKLRPICTRVSQCNRVAGLNRA